MGSRSSVRSLELGRKPRRDGQQPAYDTDLPTFPAVPGAEPRHGPESFLARVLMPLTEEKREGLYFIAERAARAWSAAFSGHRAQARTRGPPWRGNNANEKAGPGLPGRFSSSPGPFAGGGSFSRRVPGAGPGPGHRPRGPHSATLRDAVLRPLPGGTRKVFLGPLLGARCAVPIHRRGNRGSGRGRASPRRGPGLGPGPPVLFSSQLGDDAPWDCVPRRLAPPAGPLSLHKALAALIHTATS